MSTSWFKSLVDRFNGAKTQDPAAAARAEQLRTFRAAVARELDVLKDAGKAGKDAGGGNPDGANPDSGNPGSRHPESGNPADGRAALEALLRMPAEMGLPDDEVELEIEAVHGAIDLLALREDAARNGLPIVVHQHKALGQDRCHFGAAAFLASDGSDRTGRLFLTNRRLVFVATPMIALNWSAIVTIDQQARDLIIVTTAREGLYQFRCNSFSDARCGAFIAQQLKRGNNGTAADDRPGSR